MTKYRIKTQVEFEATCEKRSDGDYLVGNSDFVKSMFHLFGVDVPDDIAERIMNSPKKYSYEMIPCEGDGKWLYTPEMLTLNTQHTFVERL